MYWLIVNLDAGTAAIIYAAEAPECGENEACDGYDGERDAAQALREWREERE